MSKDKNILANNNIDIEKELMRVSQHTAYNPEAGSEDIDPLSLNDGSIPEPAGSSDFTLDCEDTNVKQAYDNAGAFAAVMEIMNRSSNLNVEFRLDKDNYHYAWIETRGVAGFKYYLKNESFNGIIRYLTKGEVTEFDPAPQDYEPAKFTDDAYVMKLFISKGFTLQLTPLFRERAGYITGFLPCRKGKITFRVKRTDELVDYLREAGQIL